mmetsp:Transcript_3330/g.5910  ORF Transcript_3330/g.5910 Transcript_3330/m.5910 type:complete len:93 (+) Transcript_3330:264-542(+)
MEVDSRLKALLAELTASATRTQKGSIDDDEGRGVINAATAFAESCAEQCATLEAKINSTRGAPALPTMRSAEVASVLQELCRRLDEGTGDAA